MTNDYETESELVSKGACDACGSSDARAVYSDKGEHCFSCGFHKHGVSEYPESTGASVPSDPEPVAGLIEGDYQTLTKRRIRQDTCEKWGYQVGKFKGKTAQIANHKTPDGKIIAQKVRTAGKEFCVLGNMKKAGLYGQWLWREGGKSLTIVEGEIDALAMSQAFDNKWPVVSINNGADGAVKDILRNLEWVESFAKVVLMLDMDDKGRAACEEIAAVLTPGKVKIASLPVKDAGQMVEERREKELVAAFWDAKVWRPDGIVCGEDLWDLVIAPDEATILYPYGCLNKLLKGIRRTEIVTLCAGSGMGKSQLAREINHHLMQMGETTGTLALEEGVKRTAIGMMSLAANLPLHDSLDDSGKPKEYPEGMLREAFDKTIGSGKARLYDHFGSTDVDNLLNKIRFMVKGFGCTYIILDHISIVVSGMEGGDERRIIDNLMTRLRTLTEELGCGMILVTHLKRPSGEKGHEDGAETSLSHLRGSASIAQLSDTVIGIERNQQSDTNPNIATLRVLKNRFLGMTGVAGHLEYKPSTGRMVELSASEYANLTVESTGFTEEEY